MDDLVKVNFQFMNSELNATTYIKKVIVTDLQNGTEMTGLSKIMKRVVSQEVS